MAQLHVRYYRRNGKFVSTLRMLYTQSLRLVVTALAGLNFLCGQSISKWIMVWALYIAFYHVITGLKYSDTLPIHDFKKLSHPLIFDLIYTMQLTIHHAAIIEDKFYVSRAIICVKAVMWLFFVTVTDMFYAYSTVWCGENSQTSWTRLQYQ